MKVFSPILLIIIAAISVSCSNQRYVNSETDDLYFTPEERFEQDNNQFTNVEEINGEDYVSESEYESSGAESGYFVKGKASSQNDANSNAQQAYGESYVQQDQNNSSQSNSEGKTINNFYGNTTYYEDDYYEDSYATRLRRFNSTNVVLGYNYYDPYFVSPYWNYGWSYWNPYPRYGWSVGWNSWYGWNAGFNYGWSPYWGNTWYGGSYWGRPWYGGYYGYGNYWGYNNYWNGYNHGYYDGWNDGLWSGSNRPTNQRGIYNGRRGLATDRGFGNNTRSDASPGNNQPQNKLVESSGRDAVGIVDREVNASNTNSKQVNASENRSLKSESKLYQTRNEQIAQNNARPGIQSGTVDINPRASEAAKRYQSESVNQPVQSRDKYNAGELSRARSESNRYDAPQRTQYQRSPTNTVQSRSSSNTSRPNVSTRSSNTPQRSTSRSDYYNPNRRGSSVSPNNNTSTRNYNYSPSRSNQGRRSNGGSYSAPRNSAPSQSRTRSASPQRSYSPAPSRSGSRSYSSPSRSRSSSPSRSVSPSPSGRSSSSAPRSSGRSGGRR